jgi:rRNA maturation endonuclease Nob1
MKAEIQQRGETLLSVLQEALDQARALEQAVRRLQEAEPETDAYDEAEADVAVEAEWLKMKTEAVIEVLDS